MDITTELMTLGNELKSDNDREYQQASDFAAACCDQNSIEQLLAGIGQEPDQADMSTWGIGKTAWRWAIKWALAGLAANYCVDNGLAFEEFSMGKFFPSDVIEQTEKFISVR